MSSSQPSSSRPSRAVLFDLDGVLAATETLKAAAHAGTIAALGGVAEQPQPLSLPPGAHPQPVLIVRRTGELDGRYPRRPGVPARRPIA